MPLSVPDLLRRLRAGLRDASSRARAGREQTNERRTVICACHDVTLFDLRRSYEDGYRHPETLKRVTAAFMGPCQGKHCAPLFADVLENLSGEPGPRPERPTARPPLYTIRLGDLVTERTDDRK